jgi:hypothetical protein
MMILVYGSWTCIGWAHVRVLRKIAGATLLVTSGCHADSQTIQANNKDPEAGTGQFFPVVATNKLEPKGPDSGKMKTATYLPHIAAVEFSGEYNIKGAPLPSG